MVKITGSRRIARGERQSPLLSRRGGAASVLTDYGPYKRDCRDGDTALLVKNKQEWYQGLEKLIVDKDWRQIIGKNARKDAKSRFDIDYMVDSWLLAYSGKVN